MAREGKALVLSEMDFQRLLKIVRAGRHATRNVAILFLSFGVGLRAKEIAALNLEDVLTPEQSLREEINLKRVMTKGAKQRHVYLTNTRVRKALEGHIQERCTPHHAFTRQSPLFVSQKGGRFSPNTLQEMIKALFLSAGFDSAKSHSGRRTFATRLIEKGVDIKAVSRLMGHSSIATTAIYVADNPARLKRIVEDVI